MRMCSFEGVHIPEVTESGLAWSRMKRRMLAASDVLLFPSLPSPALLSPAPSSETGMFNEVWVVMREAVSVSGRHEMLGGDRDG